MVKFSRYWIVLLLNYWNVDGSSNKFIIRLGGSAKTGFSKLDEMAIGAINIWRFPIDTVYKFIVWLYIPL